MNRTRAAQQTKEPDSLPVRHILLQGKCKCGNHAGPGGECAECTKKQNGQQPQLAEAPTVVHDVLRSPGQPLDPDSRSVMESRFRHDFSEVRIHTDGKASESAKAVNAAAYTVGQDIAFGAGRYEPHSRTGERLLAHELAHVVQQGRGGSGPPDIQSEQAAEQAASAFDLSTSPITLSGATAPGLACQKATEPPKAVPSITPSIREQSGRTVIAVNDVVIAESDARPGEIELSFNSQAERVDIVITVPDGKTVDLIEGAATDAAFWRLASRYTVTTRKKLKAERTLGELDGQLRPPATIETIRTVSRQKPKSGPPTKAPVPAQAPPRAVPPPAPVPEPESATSTGPAATFQFSKPPPINLSVPPTAKYGKPPTDKAIGEGRINKIIVDAMAGRSDIPPLPAGTDRKSTIETIQRAVAEAVKPLLSGLSKDARDFILDKVDSAVEKGISGIADAAIDTAKVDDTAKAAMKKAVQAGIRLKPAQATPEQK